jgi:uncharacterized integral membrane protein
MRIVRRLVLLAVVVGILVLGWGFASRNAEPVTVHYLVGVRPDVPLWVVMLGSFGLGAAVAGVLSLFELAKQGLVARRYRKTAEGLESEIHQMRSLPLVGPPDAEIAAEGAGDVPERGR